MEKASKSLISNLKKQKRENRFLLFLDNVKIIKDAIKNKTINPLFVFTIDENIDIEFKNKYLVDNKTIEQLSDVRTPQGVLCVAEYIPYIVNKPTNNFLVLDNVQDPGNVGTLIRTAKASGFNEVYLLNCASVTNPKVVRSSVGAIFTTKLYELDRQEFINFQKEWKNTLLKTDMNGENIFTFKPDNEILGIVIGNEGNGVSNEISSICSKSIKIPMIEGIESLNASVSGSIIMYEINKNRLI
ncbi:MAG: RNA methyltransferase [Clostridia bacterium]|nr:RNA methyltransferase [Clostridia bacterium]